MRPATLSRLLIALAAAAVILLGLWAAVGLPAHAHAYQADAPDEPPPVYPGNDRTPAATPERHTPCKGCDAPESPQATPMRADRTGGPDAFGYVFADNDEPNGPVYEFVDINATGNHLFLYDDDYAGPIPLGFEFPFYGQTKTEIYIASNGLIGFSPDWLWDYFNICPFPDPLTPNDIIALHWDDLLQLDTSQIAYQSFASCPIGGNDACWIVQYTDMAYLDGGYAGVFEAILFEDGAILLQYADPGDNAGADASIGIENSDGLDGLAYSCNSAGALAAERAVRFSLESLRLSKQANPSMPTPGSEFTYSIRIENALRQDITDATLIDALPPDVTLAGPVTLDPAHPEASVAESDADLPYLVSGLTLAQDEAVDVTVPVSLATTASGPRRNETSVIAGNFAEPAYAEATIHALPSCTDTVDNPFENCSFETGDLTGWVTREISGPLLPLQAAGAGVDIRYDLFTSDPPRGDFALVHGFDGEGPGVIEAAQDVDLPPDATLLEFIYRVGYDLATYFAFAPRTFSVVIQPAGGGIYPLHETVIYTAEPGRRLADSGDLPGRVDISQFAGTSVRIIFRWTVPETYSGPAMFQLDNVTVWRSRSPIFVNRPLPVAFEDRPYEHVVLTENFDPANPAAVTASALPSWLRLEDRGDGSGVLSGTPAAEDVGEHVFELMATSGGQSATQTAAVSVVERDDPPVFTQPPFAFAEPDRLYVSNAVAEDEEGSIVTVEVMETPAWISATAVDNQAVFSGTPGLAEVGPHQIVLRANDGDLSHTETFDLFVGLVNFMPTAAKADAE